MRSNLSLRFVVIALGASLAGACSHESRILSGTSAVSAAEAAANAQQELLAAEKRGCEAVGIGGGSGVGHGVGFLVDPNCAACDQAKDRQKETVERHSVYVLVKC